MDHAGQVGITDPAAANKIWAEVDKKVTDQAPWVSMFNPKYIDVLSDPCEGLPVQPAVVLPARPGSGEVRRQSTPVAEFAYEPEPELKLAPGESVQEISGRSPWRIAGRRLAGTAWRWPPWSVRA